MQLTAKLTQILSTQTGTSNNGEWKNQEIIVETDGQYPKKIWISIWGDRINEGQLHIDNLLKLEYDFGNWENNGQLYNDIKA